MILRIAFALALATPVAAQTLPQGIRPDDAARLANFDASYGAALREAMAANEPDLGLALEALKGPALPPSEALDLMQGEWSCRMIKIGGILPLTAYPPFRCRVTGEGFEKLTGSQRTKGTLDDTGDRLIYLGAGFIAGDTPPAYADLPPIADPQADPQILPEIGVVEMQTASRGRILFPAPWLESVMNLLVLTR